jgi:hypothetical protein
MNSAGATAQRCGWSVNRTETTASIVQPSANPHRTAPVTAYSAAGRNGAATSRRAATIPVANEPATIQPMRPLDPGRRSAGGAAGDDGVAGCDIERRGRVRVIMMPELPGRLVVDAVMSSPSSFCQDVAPVK